MSILWFILLVLFLTKAQNDFFNESLHLGFADYAWMHEAPMLLKDLIAHRINSHLRVNHSLQGNLVNVDDARLVG